MVTKLSQIELQQFYRRLLKTLYDRFSTFIFQIKLLTIITSNNELSLMM